MVTILLANLFAEGDVDAWLVVSKGWVFLLKEMKVFYKRQAVRFDGILWAVKKFMWMLDSDEAHL